MVLEYTGIQDGVLYFYSDPNTVGLLIVRIMCFGVSILLFISLLIIHFGRLYYIYKISKIEANMDYNGIHIQDIFPSKNDKIKLGISYYYIWSYHILTILALIFGLYTIVAGTLVELFSIVIINCSFSLLPISFSWYFVKICVYGMGILRIFNTYKGSYFDYSNKFKAFILVYLFISIIYLIIHFAIFTKGYPITENGELKWCQYGGNVISGFFTSSLEGTMNIILCFSFIRPAILLSKNSDNIPES